MTEPIDLVAPFKAKSLIGFNDYQALYNLAEDLQSDLNAANAELFELNAWKSGKRGIEDFYALREELHETQSQLTAHKAALEKCETYITKHSQPIGGFHKGGRYFELDDSIQLQAEALQEIAKLKNPNEPLDSIPTHRLPNSGIR